MQRRAYSPPKLRPIDDPPTVARLDRVFFANVLERVESRDRARLLATVARLANQVVVAERRAAVWKATARRLWKREAGRVGRYGCAAVDVRMGRQGQ